MNSFAKIKRVFYWKEDIHAKKARGSIGTRLGHILHRFYVLKIDPGRFILESCLSMMCNEQVVFCKGEVL